MKMKQINEARPSKYGNLDLCLLVNFEQVLHQETRLFACFAKSDGVFDVFVEIASSSIVGIVVPAQKCLGTVHCFGSHILYARARSSSFDWCKNNVVNLAFLTVSKQCIAYPSRGRSTKRILIAGSINHFEAG